MLRSYTRGEWWTWRHIAQTKRHLSFKQPSVRARRKSSSILIPLCPCTQVRSCCNKVFGQNSFRWGSTRNCVLLECLNTPGLYSARQSVPYVFRPWPIMLNLNTQPCSRAGVHRYWIMDDTLTLGWYICHISTSIQSQAFARLSLFIRRLEFTFCRLTSAAGFMTALSADVSLLPTLNRDSTGSENGQHPRATGVGGTHGADQLDWCQNVGLLYTPNLVFL